MSTRGKNWDNLKDKCFDVAIIGGGINGASIFRKLCKEGYKVFLIDKGDFSCGTSQASAMMIWGGLLYLKNLDFSSVYSLSRDRDILINSFTKQIISTKFRYIPNDKWGRNIYFVYLALQFYWMIGRFKRKMPIFQKKFTELDFVNASDCTRSIVYEEGLLKTSDSRFVLEWILNHQTEYSMAMNYCSVLNASYNNIDKLWSIDLRDYFSKKECSIKAKIILNCAGVWTDMVNQQFGIRSPYKHVFSKGVFIAYERPENHRIPLIFEMGESGDALTFIPWGPVSLWGPTETMAKSIDEGYSITRDDIHFLLNQASRNLKSSIAKSKIISLRCGIRPLAVPATFEADCYPLDISRIYKIVDDTNLPWISIYGGKISGCISMSQRVANNLKKRIPVAPHKNSCMQNGNADIPWTCFPGLCEKFPSIHWCVSNEFCCTLEDYLRRRTNISQWTHRQGLGLKDINLDHIKQLSTRLPEYEEHTHESHFQNYTKTVHRNFDSLLETI